MALIHVIFHWIKYEELAYKEIGNEGINIYDVFLAWHKSLH